MSYGRHTARYLRILGLSFLAVFAFAAMTAASASASAPAFEPEDGTFPVEFTGKNELGGKLETKAGRVVTCTADTSKGEIDTADTAKEIVVTFTGCKTVKFGITLNCQNTATTGEIETKKLSGKLRYIKVKEGETEREAAGMALRPTTGELFATFKCGTVQELKVRGSVVGEITPVNAAFGAEFTLTFRQAGGVQNPTSYLSKDKATDGVENCQPVSDFLETEGIKLGFGGEAFAYEQSAVEGTETLTTKENGKIVASECV